MPSAVIQSPLPSEIEQKLQELENEFQDGDLTRKGYCKKKWKLLEPHVLPTIAEKVYALQKKFANFDLSESDYCDNLIAVLKLNGITCKSPVRYDGENESGDGKTRYIKETLNGSHESSINVKNIKRENELQISVKSELGTNNDESYNSNYSSNYNIHENCNSSNCNNESDSFNNNTKNNHDNDGSSDNCIFSNTATITTSTINNNTTTSRNNKDSECSGSGMSNVYWKSSSNKTKVNIGRQTSLVSLFEKSLKRKEKVDSCKENISNDDENGYCNHVSKKIKTDDHIMDYSDADDSVNKIHSDEFQDREIKSRLSVKKQKIVPQRCPICRQLVDDPDLRLYSGHPDGSVEEFVALTDPRLSLFTGSEQTLEDGDERPHNKLTHFSIYDKNGHLCPFDSGLIERNALLYFSGYMKAIYEESSDVDGGIPTKDMGPINEWWVSGFDGGELALVGFSTAYGEYYLMEPSEEYAPFMEAVREKIFLSKLVIEFLVHDINPSYEDLLNKLHTTVPPKGITRLSEDCLLHHAQFVCDQVLSFDSSALAHEDLLITSPCMRALVKLSGVTIGKRMAMRRTERKDFKVSKPVWTKATTTDLVQQNFESYFAGQLDIETEVKGPRRRRCGVCEACQHPDCGTCIACLDMVKFGGSGRGKQACVKRRCPNMAIEEAEDDDLEDEVNPLPSNEVEEKKLLPIFKKVRVRVEKDKISWIGSPMTDSKKLLYKSVDIAGTEFSVGDYVMIEPLESGTPFGVARIEYMYEDKKNNKYFHGQIFCRATDTVLGETADHHELVLVDMCESFPMGTIVHKANVTFREAPENWCTLGGQKINENQFPDDGKSFFYQKWYDPKFVRFEDPKKYSNRENEHTFCGTCWVQVADRRFRMPVLGERISSESKSEVQYAHLEYMGQEYRPGTSIYLKCNTFTFKCTNQTTTLSMTSKESDEKKVDEEMYPEFYRKSDGTTKGSNEATPKPFCIGNIVAVLTKGKIDFPMQNDIYFRVKKFYRPENTHRGPSLSYQTDLNMLYWSDEETIVKLNNVVGICYVVYGENIDEPIIEWTKQGPNRFYFNQAYNSSNQTFEEPSSQASTLGRQGKGKGKGKGKKQESEEKRNLHCPEEWIPVPRKLRCLDVFAGCGGLSEGLHEAGIAETCWAIEKEEPAANAFKLNNPECTVFTDDCNLLLKLVLNGQKTNDKGQTLPKKGDVDLLCGGPPCQGFSGMNRFNSREYSKFKNSLIVSYLSYCEYYRPKYFILENVRNFASFKNSIILKLTLRCLLQMGYQCTFGILQAGNYGVPQTRRRLIILAAAPGLILPQYPEPTHVFSLKASQLSCMIDDKKYVSNCQWLESAPYRTITVRDAMSDLPEIRNGHRKDEMSYGGEPVSFFQRLMRGNQYQPILRDHICKEMAPLVEARIANIPTVAGSDWRNLPNISVCLSDGTFTKKLLYTHPHKKNGKSSTGALRGVCVCATGTGKACDPMDRQYNTLIPWCLPHTGNRHNHWAGLYGRLEWDGFFSTTVTNPEPMGKQGRVLHPEQTRVVSVRECARSQGFPDTYRFFGNILDKHRQVGNAVPPPMGAAIGHEIRKSYCGIVSPVEAFYMAS